MFTDQTSVVLRSRLLLSWRKIRAVYVYANIVSHHVLGAAVKIAVLAYFLFCALLLTLRYAVLPHIDHYKNDIEQLVTQTIGQPVSIATLHASWEGLRPHFSLNDVVIRDKAGRNALVLPQVSATLSWWPTLLGTVRLHSLEIDRPDLDIRRDADGSIYVAGIPLPSQQQSDGKMADWILSQHEVVVRGGTVHWNDNLRGAPELQLDHIDLALRNHWQHHALSFKATPPALLATPIDLRADFNHSPFARRISDIAHWKGIVYADVRNTDLATWKAYVDYPFEVYRGQGSIRAWLDFDQARIADLTADLTLGNTAIRLRKDLQDLDLQQISGRVSLREEVDPHSQGDQQAASTFGANGYSIGVTNFSMRTGDGMVLPATTVSESYVPGKNGQLSKTSLTATVLDLQTLADFAARLPLGTGQRQMLSDFAPHGQLRDFSAQWQGDYPAWSAYAVKGQFIGLSLKAQAARPARPRIGRMPAQAATPSIPGFENLSGRVAMSERGGTIDLDSQKLQVELPDMFVDPVMQFNRLAMQASWQFVDQNKLALNIDNMVFSQDGLNGSLSASHVMSLGQSRGKSPGVIDLTGHIDTFDINRIGHYLPQQTPADLRDWLTRALIGGQAQDVAIHLKGDLNDFPFHTDAPNAKPRGEFTVSGKIVNGSLNYVPNDIGKESAPPLWPLLEGIQGSIAFDRTRMEINAERAKTHGVALSGVRAVVEDLISPKSVLSIDGNAVGGLQEFFGYTKDSPVQEWIGGLTDDSKGSGVAKLGLKLQLPLARMQDAKVQGKLLFANDEITLFPELPKFFATNGVLEFNERGFNLNGIHANFLGGPLVMNGGGLSGAATIKAEGTLTSDGVRKFAGVSAQQLTQRVAGSTRYNVTVGIRKKRVDVMVESNLQGIALALPVPLHKEINEVLPVKVELSDVPSTDAAILREDLKLSVGAGITAHYEREKSADRNAVWRMARGGIGVNAPAVLPGSGLLLNVSLKTLNVDTWLDMIGAMPAAGKDGSAIDGMHVADYVAPDLLAVHATDMIVFGRKFDNVVLGATLQKDVWQANIDSAQTSGYITYAASTASSKARATARLSSLIIPQTAASQVAELLQGKNTTSDIPALDIVADNVELLGKRLGRLELVANNVRAAGLNEWRINKLSVINPDAELKATGKWTTKDGESVSSMTYTLDVADAGRLLTRLEFADVLRGGKGKMDGDLKWSGVPYALDYPSLSGQFHLNMASGQFLREDPTALKLLGVLSLQSLPRRLTLDFRDVFSAGFAFDGVTMGATISKGVVSTDNLKMHGVDATVLMDGSTDIDKETQNLHVVIIPEFDARTASVVYGLAVNPVIGIGSFLAQLFLREPLSKAFTEELQVTGPWKDPKVTKLARKSDNTSQNASQSATQSVLQNASQSAATQAAHTE